MFTSLQNGVIVFLAVINSSHNILYDEKQKITNARFNGISMSIFRKVESLSRRLRAAFLRLSCKHVDDSKRKLKTFLKKFSDKRHNTRLLRNMYSCRVSQNKNPKGS